MSIQRAVYLNPVEPTILSLRTPMGVDLDLDITFLKQNSDPVDPFSLLPQFALLPRSRGGVYAYDVEPIPGRVAGNVKVPGTALIDTSGYSIELYQRRPAQNPVDPPVPSGLLAKGVLRLEGSAHQQFGPLGMIAVPVIVGPQGQPGPEGPPGIQGEAGADSLVPGPQGLRGSIWTTGPGEPVATGNEIPGDMWLNETNGDVWRFNGSTWMRGTFF